MSAAPESLKPYRLYFAMFLINLAVVAGVIYLLRRETPRPIVVTTPTPSATLTGAPVARIVVTVNGAVNQPGAFTLDHTARLADALQAAGGVTAEADLSQFDLTLALQDGLEIIVPTRAGNLSDDRATLSAPNPGARVLTPILVSPPGKLNLNTATAAELETLPSIGPALAQRILDYRVQHGGFKWLAELKQVRGIGDKIYNALKELVTIQ